MARLRMGRQMRMILEALDNLGDGEYGYIDAIMRIDQTEIIFRVTGLPRVGGHYKRYKLASALRGKPIGRNLPGPSVGERFMILMACHENPGLKTTVYKHYFDRVSSTWEGYAEADRLYASYSRSLRLLLEHGFIVFGAPWGWRRDMRRGARYVITDKGRLYLAEHV